MALLYALFFFKQKTAYEMRESDWSSDVCSSDLTTIFFTRSAKYAKTFAEAVRVATFGLYSIDVYKRQPIRCLSNPSPQKLPFLRSLPYILHCKTQGRSVESILVQK